MKSSSLFFLSVATVISAVLSTLAHSIGLSSTRPSNLSPSKTPQFMSPRDLKQNSDRGAVLSSHILKVNPAAVLTNLASGQLRHKATVMFIKLTTALRGSNETGLAPA